MYDRGVQRKIILNLCKSFDRPSSCVGVPNPRLRPKSKRELQKGKNGRPPGGSGLIGIPTVLRLPEEMTCRFL